MRQGEKPGKTKAESRRSVGRKSPKNDPSGRRELEKRLAEALQREAESLEQQTATAAILRVISGSPTDIRPVLNAVVESALRLCEAQDASIFRRVGDRLLFVAHHGPIAFGPVGEFSIALVRGTANGRSVLDAQTIHVADLQTEVDEYPEGSELARRFGYRTTLNVPLIREGVAIGSISLRRTAAQLFSQRQIDLLQTFADQAVIAIENVRLSAELEGRNRDLTATSEILRVISSSPTDVQPVFNAIADSALHLCAAKHGNVFLFDGELVHLAAVAGTDREGTEAVRRSFPQRPGPASATTRAILTRRPVIIPNVSEDPEFELTEMVRVAGFRSVMSIPMLRAGGPLGAITVTRAEAGPFSETQLALLQTFADQAVIAIENARLFTELQEKNHALTEAHAQVTEALEQQTATAEILRVISQSQTDVQPVFDTIVRGAARLCHAVMASVLLTDGRTLYLPANHGGSPEAMATVRARFPRPLDMESVAGVAILTRSVVHVPDVLEPSVVEFTRQAGQVLGYRSLVTVPMLREGRAVGAISVCRREPGRFSDAEVELLQTFADQAVIAIENVRLFTELQASNRELTTALDTQTATSDILRVISRSQKDVQPVFEAIAENAARLVQAWSVTVLRWDGESIHLAAERGGLPGSGQHLRDESPWLPNTTSGPGRCIATGTVIHVPDVDLEPEDDTATRELAHGRGWRSNLCVPMLRDGSPIGAISVTRVQAGPFSPGAIELLETFADQAVIAIENVRLFKELEARTGELTQSVEQLTALGEVGQVVSSSLDLETVLTTIVSQAVQLSGLDGGTVFEYNEASEEFVQRATTGSARVLTGRAVVRKGEGVVGRTAVTFEPVEVSDIRVEGAYESRLREALVEAGVRAIIAVPIIREGRLLGGFAVNRNAPGEFPPETVELLRTFATQSALAIQNARLFREIAEKSAQLEAASRHKSEFLANMSHELRTPLNAIIGFSEILAEKMFGDVNEKQTEYLQDILESGRHLLSLINDILDLSKIEAGRMELELTDFDLPSAIDNALILVRERASRRGIRLASTVDERLGMIGGDERKVKQVLLNLLSNALKFTPEGGRIEVGARLEDGMAEVSVTDTGIGIAPADQAAVFEEFRQVGTADKKAEGTGLGLALSRKFIELHGGRIWVKSQLGAGSTFTFTLPLRR